MADNMNVTVRDPLAPRRQMPPIVIGRAGEYGATTVTFDLRGLIDRYGAGVPTLLHKRPPDDEAYIVPLSAVDTETHDRTEMPDSETLVWHVGQVATSYVGNGKIELQWHPEGAAKKSAQFDVVVLGTIGNPVSEIPNAQQIYLDVMQGIADDAEDAADRAEAAAEHYPKIVNGNWYVWDVTNSEWVDTGFSARGPAGDKGDNGDTGYSPEIRVTDISGGHRLDIYNELGHETADVMDGIDGTDGEDGTDGVSPTVAVTDIAGGHRVTITDADGAHTFDVMDGEDGVDGRSPAITVTAITGGHRVTITDETHPFGQSFDVMDGEDAQTVYVTPEQFGAVGDGVTDDTTALRAALKYCIDNKRVLFLANQYYITGSLLTSADYANEIAVNIEGQKPLSENVYAVSGYGGIKTSTGVNVFDGVSLSGSISRVTFAPTARTQTGSIFHNCALYSLTFSECTVSNVLAFCRNTSLNRNSVVENSRFQTVYYFAKCDSGAQILCTDSTIRGNYINGGMEMTGNHCFEWGGFNGSSISDNFIDYYHTIFYPSFSGGGSFSGGVCAGNNFQVFRHLYIKPANVSGFIFQSIGDCFNWNDPASLQKLSNYEVLTYTGHDGQTHDMPPSILISYETGTISIRNAILQRNIGNVVFLKEGITNYEYARAEMTVINGQGRNYANSVALADSIYGAGTYRKNMIDIPWVRDVQNLGDIGLAWSTVWYPGIRARKDNHVYRYHWIYNGSKWGATWVDETQVVPTMATDPNMSDWTSGKTVDAATMKTVVTSAGLKVSALEDDVSELARGKANTSDIPAAVSELTNDSGYQTAQDVQTAIAGVRQLPTVTASDNGKFLRVVSGAWAAATVPSAESNSFGGGS